MAEKDINERARQLSSQRVEPGREYENLQTAQSQLLEISAEQKKNLSEKKILDNTTAQENQILAQAAEVGAASIGAGSGMALNSATQGTLAKYGLSRPQTTSTQKKETRSVETKQNITIHNNTTNITNNTTTVPANIGGPLQGRPVQFKEATDGNGGMGKFRDWLNKAFTRQNEEAAKRNREYDRRELALTKSSNRVMRKLEEFSKDLSKKLDPRNIAKPVTSAFSTILKIFGVSIFAANFDKILAGLENIQTGARDFIAWIKGDKEKEPKLITNMKNMFRGLFFGGESAKIDYQEGKGLFGNLGELIKDTFKDLGKDISKGFKDMLDTIGEEFKKRNNMAQQLFSSSPIVFDKKDIGGYVGKLIERLTDYIGIILTGDKAAMKQTEKQAKAYEEEIRNVDDKKRMYNLTMDSTTRIGGGNKSEGVSYGIASYFAEPEQNIANNGRMFSAGRINPVDHMRYGNYASPWLDPTTMLDSNYELNNDDLSFNGQLMDTRNTYRDIKAGRSFSGSAFYNGLVRLRNYSNKNTQKTHFADPGIIKDLLGTNELPQGFRETQYFFIVRDKTLGELQQLEAAKNILRQRIKRNNLTNSIKQTQASLESLLVFIPYVNYIAFTDCTLKALGYYFRNFESKALQDTINKMSGGAKGDSLIPMTVESLKAAWMKYGDYEIVLKKKPNEQQKSDFGIFKGTNNGITWDPDSNRIKISVDPGKIGRLQDTTKVDESEDGSQILIKIDDNAYKNLFDDNALKAIIKVAKDEHSKNDPKSVSDRIFDWRDVVEFGSSGINKILDSVSGVEGFDPDYNNATAVGQMKQTVEVLSGKPNAQLESYYSAASVSNEAKDRRIESSAITQRDVYGSPPPDRNDGTGAKIGGTFDIPESREYEVPGANETVEAPPSNFMWNGGGNSYPYLNENQSNEGESEPKHIMETTPQNKQTTSEQITPEDTQQSEDGIIYGPKGAFDVNAASRWIMENATLEHFGNGSEINGWCGKAVGLALKNGGVDLPGDDTTGGYHGNGYYTALKDLGWTEISQSEPNKPGDVMVMDPAEGHEYGHVAFYTGVGNRGKQPGWWSDFQQATRLGMADEDKKKYSYHILRYGVGWTGEKVKKFGPKYKSIPKFNFYKHGWDRYKAKYGDIEYGDYVNKFFAPTSEDDVAGKRKQQLALNESHYAGGENYNVSNAVYYTPNKSEITEGSGRNGGLFSVLRTGRDLLAKAIMSDENRTREAWNGQFKEMLFAGGKFKDDSELRALTAGDMSAVNTYISNPDPNRRFYADIDSAQHISNTQKRYIKALFDENGEIKKTADNNNKVISKTLLNIVNELRKGNDISAVNTQLSGAMIDATLASAQTTSQATMNAMAGLTQNQENSGIPRITNNDTNIGM